MNYQNIRGGVVNLGEISPIKIELEKPNDIINFHQQIVDYPYNF